MRSWTTTLGAIWRRFYFPLPTNYAICHRSFCRRHTLEMQLLLLYKKDIWAKLVLTAAKKTAKHTIWQVHLVSYLLQLSKHGFIAMTMTITSVDTYKQSWPNPRQYRLIFHNCTTFYCYLVSVLPTLAFLFNQHVSMVTIIIIIIIRLLTHLVSFNRRIISAERSHFKCCRMRDCTVQI